MKKTLLLLSLALSLALVFGCKAKEEDSEKEEKTQSAKMEIPDKGEAAAAADSIDTPPELTLDHAIAGMGLGANNRIAIRVKPFVDANLLDLAMEAIPIDQKAEYEAFVKESGFDPGKSIDGLLLYTDASLDNLDAGTESVIVFGLNGGVDEKLINYLYEKKDDAESDSDFNGTIVLLAPLDKAVRRENRDRPQRAR